MITTAVNLPNVNQESFDSALQVYRKKSGRPCEYTDEIAIEICERVASGESIRSICKDPRMPSSPTVYDWQKHVPAFASRYAAARVQQATGFVHEGLEILDNSDDSAMSKVRKAEAQANYRLSLAKCYDRETYGDKVSQDISVHGVVVQTSCRELDDLLNGRRPPQDIVNIAVEQP